MESKSEAKQAPPTMPAAGFIPVRQFIGKGNPLPICPASYYAYVKAGKLPPPVKIGRRSVIPVEDARQLIDDLKTGRLELA